MAHSEQDIKLRTKAAYLSLFVGVFMLILKMSAYLITDSSALMSDAMESVVHVAAIAFVVFCIHYSHQPPDQDHPYGHGKIESFSVGFEGGLICIAGIAIIWETISNLADGYSMRSLEIGISAAMAAAVINVWLGFHLIKIGKKTDSTILIADGKHVLSDSYTSFSIVAGMLIVKFTGWVILDAIIAILVALHLFYMGFQLLKEAVSKLMDTIEPDVLQKIVDVINESRKDDWRDVHNLRIHTNGVYIHIDFHLVVPRDWTVLKAHNTMDKLEHQILKKLESKGSVMIHLDPEIDQALEKELSDKQLDRHGEFTVDSVTRIVLEPLSEATGPA